MEKKSIREIISVIFKAMTLAMGAAVVVLSCMGSLEAETAVTLLGIGLACAGAAMLGKNDGTSATGCLLMQAYQMLEERDDHIDRYLSVTVLGRNGYSISRTILPALAAFTVTVILLPVFHLSPLSAAAILLLSLAGALQGVIIGLLIVRISSNKLEGMAVTKLSSLMMLGAVTPYFVPAPFSFGFSFLPSFWMGKVVMEGSLLDLLLSIAVAGLYLLTV